MGGRQFMYQAEVRHEGLHKYRLIRGRDRYVVQQQAANQKAAWDEMWHRKQDAEAKRHDRERAAREKEDKKQIALERTEQAQRALQQLEGLLKHTLSVDDTVDWESLKDHSRCPVPRPAKPEKLQVPPKPDASCVAYQARFSWLDYLFPSRKERKRAEARERLKRAHARWVSDVEELKRRAVEIVRKYKAEVAAWQQANQKYVREQQERNVAVDRQRILYEQGDTGAIVDYSQMVLGNSKYPDFFPQSWDLDYVPETKVLVVDYALPSVDDLPRVKEVKYVQTRDEFQEVHLTGPALNSLYDSVLYQVALRTIHELFEADVIKEIQAVVFNGWVNSIDKGTGQEVNACILSLQASREEFLAVNLGNIDPKTCFRALKGVAAAKLHGLSPVAPIMQIDREDKRFVCAYEVADQLSEGYNLAAMDWEDFEHLIRQLFEQEFSQEGSEVKVTRASRDGGVDAVVFDPDPIRGGKIVIQAKRYTNTVGVGAVRDLYGTLVNEGATKGILVTTSNYGPEAFEFAKGKPITLLDGSNLLHLLAKHGHKARIDLKEAKQIMADREKES